MTVLSTLVEERDSKMAEVAEIVGTDAEPREISDEDEQRAKSILEDVDALEERIGEETRKARRQELMADARSRVTPPVEVDVKVVDEPPVYGPESPNSFYADQIWVQSRSPFDPHHQMAGQRLTQWSHQVEREYANGTKAGKAAGKQLRELFRESSPEEHRAAMAEIRERGRVSLEQKEQRAVTTGTGATASASGGGGAALVSPFIFAAYVPYREYGRAFCDQCNHQPIPDYGRQAALAA